MALQWMGPAKSLHPLLVASIQAAFLSSLIPSSLGSAIGYPLPSSFKTRHWPHCNRMGHNTSLASAPSLPDKTSGSPVGNARPLPWLAGSPAQPPHLLLKGQGHLYKFPRAQGLSHAHMVLQVRLPLATPTPGELLASQVPSGVTSMEKPFGSTYAAPALPPFTPCSLSLPSVPHPAVLL